MNLYKYLDRNLSRADPTPAIDFSIRAEKHPDGRISFYIHADGRDSDTEDYWVDGNKLTEKRLAFEPLPESVRKDVLNATRRFQAFWGFGDKNALCVPINCDKNNVADFIESVKGVTANYCGTEGDRFRIFRPAFGNRFASLDGPIAALTHAQEPKP
jgi:hypothetical protein